MELSILQKQIIFNVNRLEDQTLLKYCTGFLTISLVCLMVAINTTYANENMPLETVQNRLNLAQSYLNSNEAEMIRESKNVDALQFLSKAQSFLERAYIDLEAGRLNQSAENTDQSISAFSAAGDMFARSGKSSKQVSSGNKAIRTEIDAYLSSFMSALAEKGPSMAGLLDQQEIADLIARAEKLQSTNNHQSATSILNQAKQLIVLALTKIRSNETVVYTLEFQTPADEYRYERERYKEYVTLSQQILNQGQLEESRKLMFDKLQQKSDEFNQLAIDMASKGNHQAAIKQMEEALKKLVQGLQLLGIPVSL